MIRKLRKAQWVYDCELCGTRSLPSPDLFGVYEAKNRHLNGPRHLANALRAAYEPFKAAFTQIANAYGAMATTIIDSVMPAMEQASYVLAPPRNIPHDPSLWADRRKWGGR